MEVYVGVFNKLPKFKGKGYINLQLGADKNTNNIADAKDNIGDNISYKNPNYCELTGLYWIWKNVNNDIIGMTHYRRFFYKRLLVFNKCNVIKENQVEKIMKKYDVILPEEGHLFNKSIYDQYKKSHDIEDLEKCGQVIKRLYPDYFDTFNKVTHSNHYHPYNMFIGKKKVIDEYAKWLFSILFELENYIDITKKDKYNARVYGFLGERLFNVWLIKNNIKIKELPVYNVESSIIKQELISIIKNIFLKGRNSK